MKLEKEKENIKMMAFCMIDLKKGVKMAILVQPIFPFGTICLLEGLDWYLFDMDD